jgi:nitronate monooxygenase
MTAFGDDPRGRTRAFCERLGLQVPILLAPMSGASPPSLSIAVMRSGRMGACGALPMQPTEIEQWSAAVRASSDGPSQINLWVRDPPPRRDHEHEARVREFSSSGGPTVTAKAGDATPPTFEEQCQAVLQIAPAAASSIMGLS